MPRHPVDGRDASQAPASAPSRRSADRDKTTTLLQHMPRSTLARTTLRCLSRGRDSLSLSRRRSISEAAATEGERGDAAESRDLWGVEKTYPSRSGTKQREQGLPIAAGSGQRRVTRGACVSSKESSTYAFGGQDFVVAAEVGGAPATSGPAGARCRLVAVHVLAVVRVASHARPTSVAADGQPAGRILSTFLNNRTGGGHKSGDVGVHGSSARPCPPPSAHSSPC